MRLRMLGGIATGVCLALAMGEYALANDANMRLDPEPKDAIEALRAAGVSRSPEGVAVLLCGTDANRVLTGCALASEQPDKVGLGRAAMALAPNYQSSAAGPVRVTVAFKAYEAAKWRERPDASLFMRALRRAGVQNPNGRAKLNCLVGVDGLLISCRVIESTPTPQYGQAGMMVASNFRYKPTSYGGVAIESRAVIPLDFRMS